ncbi:Hypothetical predicted protein [Mytilus galloprovincialis]|uniref:Integrase catalytic domain-containing protein n=1 Tax=Mytilus galloprovincialis TaxID=29158 RepID=A0A8B6CG63_MYTGA|nr:Hypothetical predicted protein [Mytilus galloprovincialis]
MAKTNDDIEDQNTEDETLWIQQKTTDEIIQAQKSDEILGKLYQMKTESKDKPKWGDIAIQNPIIKRYWSQWDRIVFENGVLNRQWLDTITNVTVNQLLVPSCWTKDILQLLHDNPTSGHLGIHKTVARVRRRFYWVDFKTDILKWIQQCTMCTSRKQPPRRAKSKMKQYQVGAPMERVALDIIGPFPLSKKGNKYALIVSDYFTRWAEGYPMPDMETKTIIDNFVNNFVCRFGVPRQIHTDQGRQFESALFKELCTRLCIDKTRTTPYRPQSDGLVERLNRSLEEILSKYVSSNQKDWDEQLPWAFMAYRSSVHESTKFSPCKMMLGREIELPIDLIYGPHPQHEEFIDETQVVNEHMIQITQNMWKVHEKARRNMVNASENQKKQYDIKSYQHSYKKGNVVWLYTPTRVKNISPKLQRKWDGPYFIVTVLSDVTYKIQKNPSSRSQVVHHDRLKPYYGEVNNWVI